MSSPSEQENITAIQVRVGPGTQELEGQNSREGASQRRDKDRPSGHPITGDA